MKKVMVRGGLRGGGDSRGKNKCVGVRAEEIGE